MDKLKFNVTKISEAPKPVRGDHKNYYDGLFKELNSLQQDEVVVIRFKSELEYRRVATQIRKRYGNGVFSFRRTSNTDLEYVLKQVKSKNK